MIRELDVRIGCDVLTEYRRDEWAEMSFETGVALERQFPGTTVWVQVTPLEPVTLVLTDPPKSRKDVVRFLKARFPTVRTRLQPVRRTS